MGKSISKAFKKVVGGTLNTIGLGADAPAQQAAVPIPAADTAVPDTTVEDVETQATDVAAKKPQKVGKRALQVSRTSGGGISL